PSGPERAPPLGGVPAVDLHRVVGGGGALVVPDRSRFVAGGAGVDQQRFLVHVDHAGQGVGVGVGGQLGRAGRAPASSAHGAAAARASRVSASRGSGGAGGVAGWSAATSSRLTGNPSFS